MPTSKSALKSIPAELPPCDGPKLGLFKYHNSRIQWLDKLSDEEAEEDGSSEGYVFRAIIHGREYAIKVFKFFNPIDNEHFWGPLLGEETPLDTAAYYTDPFYAECRAYGRINEVIRPSRLIKSAAIPCHGYFFLKPKDEKILAGRHIDFELGNVDLDYQRTTVGGCRVRAIVKDIASPDTGISNKTLSRALARVVALNKAGIYNMDIRLANFRDGKLVDFGSSWTVPHAILDALDTRAAHESILADRVMFQSMLEDEEFLDSSKLQSRHLMSLRSQSFK